MKEKIAKISILANVILTGGKMTVDPLSNFFYRFSARYLHFCK